MTDASIVHSQLTDFQNHYRYVRDCLEGEMAVKAAGVTYLPMPNPTAEDASERYEAYKTRAVFFNVTRNTLAGLVGMVFQREPEIKLPPILETMQQNASGSGITLEQQAKRAAGYTLGFGRCGIFVDFPKNENGSPISRADLQSGEFTPNLHVYAPWEVINWKTEVVNSRERLTLVVIAESYVKKQNIFQDEIDTRYRVLVLQDTYRVEIWYKDNTGTPGETYVPTDSAGQPLREIPFTFVGSENNDAKPDMPPLYSMASLNIAHYRNSADYEELTFLVGQPTVWVSGLNMEWYNTVLKGKIMFGARTALALPVGADCGTIQAEPNTIAFEAMQHKERQMSSLGAKLIEQKTVQRTATEAGIEDTAENSTLVTSANNVSTAFTMALRHAARFVEKGIAEGPEISFKINTDFAAIIATPEQRAKVVDEWQKGAITFGEMRAYLRKAGVATVDDKEAKKEIEADKAASLELEASFENNGPPANA